MARNDLMALVREKWLERNGWAVAEDALFADYINGLDNIELLQILDEIISEIDEETEEDMAELNKAIHDTNG